LEHRRTERQHQQVQLSTNIRLLQGQLEERERIQDSLHHQAQGALLRIKWAVEQAQRDWLRHDSTTPPNALRRVEEQLVDYSIQLRKFVKSIYPADLRELGLLHSVRQFTIDLPLDIRVNIPDVRWPDHVELVAYLSICEALTNIAKHANATSASVYVYEKLTFLSVEIVDNGVGGARLGPGLGLNSMRTRAKAIGGEFDLSSPARGGTTIRLRIPISNNVADNE
ncbi:MAG: hypothetical protein LC775_15045, partial [Acidobacteria bacterium]|nr:hypothetical protein [Acidobacteriota bacterium]